MTDKIFNFLINYFSNMNDRGVDEMNNFRGDITSNEIVEWLKNIQTSPEQPSEDLEKAAEEYASMSQIAYKGIHCTYVDDQHAFIAGADWQKEQDKAIIERAEDHAKLAGMALGEKEAINKAYKWLEDNVENYVWCGEGDLGICGDFLPDFESAMNV